MKTLVTRKVIEDWVKQPSPHNIYWRPLTVSGKLEEIRCVVVGERPATQILKSERQLDVYLDMIMDSDIFEAALAGKPSKTRECFGNLANWLGDSGWGSYAQLNVMPLPLLKGQNIENMWYEKGFELFQDVMKTLGPKLVITHGKEAQEKASKFLLPSVGFAGTAFLEKCKICDMGSMQSTIGNQVTFLVTEHPWKYKTMPHRFEPLRKAIAKYRRLPAEAR